MSQLLNVGNQCSVCSQVDFLPIPCPHCQQTLCKDHIKPEAHSCSASGAPSTLSVFATKLPKCTLDKCSKISLNAACTKCQKSFCAEHRESASHNCSPIEPPSQPTKNEAARALLAKNFPSTSNATSKTSVKRQPGKSADPKKTAALRKLELMKLRQQAEPLDPRNLKSTLPPDKRRFFKAKMDGRPIKDFWVEKNLLTGKAFDLLVTHFGIPTVETNKYQLHISADEQEEEKRSLEYDKPLADQMEDGEVLLISPDTSSNLPAAI